MEPGGMLEPIFDYQFRVILLGDSTVGKSSLLKYFTEGKFDEGCEPTVGVDFFARLVEIKPGLRVKLQLWDTAGQERFRYVNIYWQAVYSASVVNARHSRTMPSRRTAIPGI